MDLNRLIKTFAALLGTAAAAVLAIAGYYYYNLPDRFYVSESSDFKLSSFFEIAPSPVCGALAADSSPESAGLSLRLFGAVPIKNVQTRKISSAMLVPGGEPFGVKLVSDGVMVVDMEEKSCPAAKCGIKCGDVVISVNGIRVSTNKDISEAVRNSGGQTVPVVLRRNGEEMTVKLTPEICGGSYRAGMWVRDSSAGIGTVTFYDEATGLFGGLGHPVCDSDTGKTVPIKNGLAQKAEIHGYNRSEFGSPGALLGSFCGGSPSGEIFSNGRSGVYGRLNEPPSEKASVPLGFRQEVKTGDAVILTTIDGNKPKEYSIKIEEIHLDAGDCKHMVIRVTDEELLKKTGGILQGMSGSPIIQDGKLVGAVTHVFVRNTEMGYGIFADEMYSDALAAAGITEELAS